MTRMRFFIGFILVCAAILIAVQPITMSVTAQGQNILINGTMDEYYGIGGARVVPTGWKYSANIETSTSKHVWQFENTQYGGSWHVSTMSAAFTFIGSQFVPGVRRGTPLRFSASANVFTCNQQTSCIDSNGRRTSEQASGARTRIGIDPTGGQDPNAASVIWSPFISPWDNFQQMSVDGTSQNDNGVTVFLYYTQASSMLLNNVYWDNATLSAPGSGAPLPTLPGGTPAPTATPIPPAGVPFVTPQGQQSDGSVVHTVQSGDTLSSIAFAYGVTVAQIRELNGIPEGEFLLQPGQRLIIKPPDENIIYITATPEGFVGEVVVDVTPTPTQTEFFPTATPSQAPIQPTPTRRAGGFGPVVITVAPGGGASGEPTLESTLEPGLKPTLEQRRSAG
jgi:LysM repeat protein